MTRWRLKQGFVGTGILDLCGVYMVVFIQFMELYAKDFGGVHIIF